ncbi:intraflagellar transport protein 43 homolog B-like isoform X3 [Haliotis rufescens]|uniref:intraflagellar transport protein 43 homolog B-like isoform X3 n=1 Tax=Haliotis rufescens TaxID=6454 RepID=UPI00201F3313|nr:intraflagellar transport protein 43 homolog B-like isoform X3 [Haliotis rufescens]
MDDEDLDFQPTAKSRSAKQGRRAQRSAAAVDDDGPEEDAPVSQPPSNKDGPPGRPSKAVSGWGEEAPRKSRERLRPRSPDQESDSDQDIPVIPELEDQQEEDMSTKVAVAPNVAVNRVATYRELDNDLLRQAAFLTLDNEIDLKLLTKAVSPEQDLIEEDRPWDWDRLFTEVTSEMISDVEKEEFKEHESINEVV